MRRETITCDSCGKAVSLGRVECHARPVMSPNDRGVLGNIELGDFDVCSECFKTRTMREILLNRQKRKEAV